MHRLVTFEGVQHRAELLWRVGTCGVVHGPQKLVCALVTRQVHLSLRGQTLHYFNEGDKMQF